MLWQQLAKAVPLYKKTTNNDKGYLETINNPEPKQIVWFLNHWGITRRHFDVGKISKCIIDSKNLLEKFSNYRIETAELIPLKDDIQDVFQRFLKATDSPVAASKVLHVLVPQFFVMWDNAIRAGYGCGIGNRWVAETTNETYYIFLIRVQNKLRKAVQSYIGSRSIKNLGEASNALKKELYANGRKTLAKIIDEYNFMKFTKGTEELWVES